MMRVFGKPDGKPELEEVDILEKLRALLAEKLSPRPEAVHEYVALLFISCALNRKMSGQGHMEAVKSPRRLDEGTSVICIPPTRLKLKGLGKMVNREREPKPYEALKARLGAHRGDPAKAFAEPSYKQDKAGNRIQQIKAVRTEQMQKTDVWVCNQNGIADNVTMVRVSMLEKGGKYYLVPICSWQVAKGTLPDKAIIALKDEEEWQPIDDSFNFKFPLYPNDLAEVITKKARISGYFVNCRRGTGNINIRIHDPGNKVGENGIPEGIGAGTVLSF